MINKLSLEKVKDSIIGSATRRGISGGEKKRCAIGKELLSSPTILFLDEPTSGLDSFQAISVIQALQKMALTGKIVVSVIHQPSSAIFKLFDSLLLLADGKVVYSGMYTIYIFFYYSTTVLQWLWIILKQARQATQLTTLHSLVTTVHRSTTRVITCWILSQLILEMKHQKQTVSRT